MPVLRHGSRRHLPFRHDAVAVSIRELLRRRRAKCYRPVVEDADSLRDYFGVERGTPILLVSVAQDQPLEDYWAFRRITNVPKLLAQLDLSGVTVPNFSFFLDAPRTHTIWNRKRMMVVAEELAAAGVPVVPHLNALERADWRFWEDLLSSQQLSCVAKEFQTGLKRRACGLDAIDTLADLQERVGHSLHPIAIGGAQYVERLAVRFRSFTIADSVPFMKTIYRRELVRSGAKLRPRRCQLGLDELLQRNFGIYAAHLAARTRAQSSSKQFCFTT